MTFFKRLLPLVAVCIVSTSGCTTLYKPPVAQPPQVADRTMSEDMLDSLPAAKQKVAVAVYDFQDQSGQMAANDSFATYSRAVTQGGLAILNKALLDAAHRHWFTVIERGGLKNLLQERQLISAMRLSYLGPNGQKMGPVSPMLYAGMILEGGIVSYESNVATGGLGARYLGIGADTQYRRDIVTVYLRAVSSQTGEILLSTNASKTIYSTAVDTSVFKYVSVDKLLEAESGFTINEPPQFAVRQAIEMCVYSHIMEGAMDGLWEFADPKAGQAAVADYITRKNGAPPPVPPSQPTTLLPPYSPPTAMSAPAPAAAPTPVAAVAPAAAPMQVTKNATTAPMPTPSPNTASNSPPQQTMILVPAPVAGGQKTSVVPSNTNGNSDSAAPAYY